MDAFRTRRHLSEILIFAFLAVATPGSLVAQQKAGVTEITPTLLVFATNSGNVVASVGPDGVLLAGTPASASTPFVNKIVRQRTKSLVRYVVIFPESVAKSEGDAGWGRLGAFVAMHENALRRLGGDIMGAPGPPPSRFAELAVDRPSIAFSEVLRRPGSDSNGHVAKISVEHLSR
jgi:hypothetical protein